ncbi:MAG: DUF5060 domain-containing protein [Paludibacter sp.]|nr:DUF5060 domain-containing protein [Paludibacter sp.]
MKKTYLFILLFSLIVVTIKAAEVGTSAVYSVAEITFAGPSQTQDNPNLDFWVTFTHESGSPSYKIWGFYDGNGTGGNSGSVFKVRFCPSKTGKWILQDVYSTATLLNNQKEGDYVTATASSHHGFWAVETSTGGGRWYKRNDGTHQFVIGNTHYDFLWKRDAAGITSDVNGNANYYKKLRCMIDGSEGYNGAPPAGTYPNVGFYNSKADVAIKAALIKDLIMDLILYKRLYLDNGEAYVKYIAARYGSYPNVWFCLANEWDIKDPLTSTQAIAMGQQLRKYIPYGNPLSIHPNSGTGWNTALNTTPAWNDHKIAQLKTKDLSDAAANTILNYNRTPIGMPSINDENGYEGAGDVYTKEDVIEGVLGSFSGGGFGSTAYKPAKGTGQYYNGNFNATEHSASAYLKWLADAINANIEFWKLQPVVNSSSIFPAASTEFKVLQQTGTQFAIFTDAAANITANLPAGTWTLKQINAIDKTITTTNNLSGNYSFSAPNSRACINYFYLANASSSPVITAPLASTTFSPGQSVTATATGLNLSWAISIVGGSTFASGTGQSITFQIPTNAANNAQLKIQLTGGTSSNEVVSQLNTILDDSPVIQPITQTVVANTAFSIQLTATGTGTPMTWSSASLPVGTILTTDGLLQGTIATSGNKSLTVTVTDVDGDVNSQTLALQVIDASQPFCETGGMVTVECENYTSKNINGDVIGWEKETTASGYAGSGYMNTTINNYANGIWIEAADLSYDVTFNTTGNYYMWIYRYAPTSSSNSAYVGMNGTAVGATFDNGTGTGWGWVKHTTTFSVSSAGTKTINIRRREQGMGVDKFILTTNASYTPSGNAQVESAKCSSAVQVITNVTNGPKYVQATGLKANDTYYTDRTYTISTLPSALVGAEFIKAANDDKSLTTENLFSATFGTSARVYIAYGATATSVPNWMTNLGFTKIANQQITTSDITFDLYSANLTGTVVFGANKAAGSVGAGSTYFVIAVPEAGSTLKIKGNGTQDTEVQSTVGIYPNPTKNYVTVSAGSRINRIELISASGRVMDMKQIGADQANIQLSAYPNGIYVMVVSLENGQLLRKKLVVE